MVKDRKADISRIRGSAVSPASVEEHLVPPRLFHHEDLTQILESSNSIDQEALTNLLHYIHFVDGSLAVLLRHSEYEESILVRAYPEPCVGKRLTCHWSNEKPSDLDWEDYQFLHLVIDFGPSMILVPAIVEETDGESFTVQLPDTSYVMGQRQARRYVCREIAVELIQSGFLARGKLVDFSPMAFRIRVKPASSSSFRWFNSDESVTVHFRNDQEIILSTLCQCIRQQGDEPDREIVLVPVRESIKRFKRRKIRNPRQRLAPSPTLFFEHPFLEKKIRLNIFDISSSGFSVYETAKEAVLIPGMIIPELTIDFVGASHIKCTAQVIHRTGEGKKGVHCGLAILDMDIKSYSRLSHIVTNAHDPKAFVSGEIDLDTLWELFFETGFIYPKKYGLIHSRREDFKETYRKLYQGSPEIAAHFTYQQNGRIYGHISMIRTYEKAWMIHHHAARAVESRRAGFIVLKQVMHYLNDLHRLPSGKMDYAMSYFRPGSKFPDRVFGGFARYLKNPRGCSLDLFSYLPYPTLSLGISLPEDWVLRECSGLDLLELNRFYKHHSGGLLLDMMGLERRNSNDETVEDLFEKLGFMRRWNAFSLIQNGKLNAVLIADQSDPGLNLSELLNGIKILVVDTESLPWDILSIAIGKLTSLYEMGKVPILIYPMEYVKANGIPHEKQYQLWILDVRYGDEYMEFMQRKFRTGNK